MVLRNSRHRKDGQELVLDRGKIQLQSEAAEVYFKDIEIRSLQAIPREYENFYKTATR
jgi:hypothetical protein